MMTTKNPPVEPPAPSSPRLPAGSAGPLALEPGGARLVDLAAGPDREREAVLQAVPPRGIVKLHSRKVTVHRVDVHRGPVEIDAPSRARYQPPSWRYTKTSSYKCRSSASGLGQFSQNRDLPRRRWGADQHQFLGRGAMQRARFSLRSCAPARAHKQRQPLEPFSHRRAAGAIGLRPHRVRGARFSRKACPAKMNLQIGRKARLRRFCFFVWFTPFCPFCHQYRPPPTPAQSSG